MDGAAPKRNITLIASGAVFGLLYGASIRLADVSQQFCFHGRVSGVCGLFAIGDGVCHRIHRRSASATTPLDMVLAALDSAGRG